MQTTTTGIESAVKKAFVVESHFTQFFNATPKALGLAVESHVDADGHPQDRYIGARPALQVLGSTSRGEGLFSTMAEYRPQFHARAVVYRLRLTRFGFACGSVLCAFCRAPPHALS